MIQIPELDMSVPHGHKVGAVLGEGHARHFTRHLVGCYDHVFLQEDKSTTHVNITVALRGAGCGLKKTKYLPRPDVDHHVVLVSHTDDVFAVGGEGHTRDAILVLLELGHLPSRCHVPQSHGRQVTALVKKKREGCVDEEEQVRVNSSIITGEGPFFCVSPFFESTGAAGCKQ